MKASEMFEKAAKEVLKPDGWRKGQYGWWAEEDSPVCAIGACARVVHQHFVSQGMLTTDHAGGWVGLIFTAIRKALNTAGLDDEEEVINFNDGEADFADEVAGYLNDLAANACTKEEEEN